VNIKIDPVSLIVHLAQTLDTHPMFNKIKDNDGCLVVPADQYEYFAHDMGMVIGILLSKIAQPDMPPEQAPENEDESQPDEEQEEQ
jgi:hypothetical protein